jgi:hypothetical protein
MAQVLLNLPDVYAFEKQMRCKGMAQTMNGSRFITRLPGSLPHQALRNLITDMVAAHHPAPGIDRKVIGRKEVLPPELLRGRRIFAVKREGQIDSTMPGRQILIMNAPDGLDLILEWFIKFTGKKRAPILVPLCGPDNDQMIGKIQILDSQPDQFRYPESGAVSELK